MRAVRLAGGLALPLFLWATPAGAQPAVPGPTPDEEEALRKALQEDAAARPAGLAAPAGSGSVLAPAGATFAPSGTGTTNPDISAILDVAGGWYSAEDPGETGGHDPAQTGFNLQALEMAVTANADPYFGVFGTLVFGAEGVELEEAWAQTLALPWNLQVRAGQMLTPFGRINATHPHSWSFLDQPLVIGKFLGPDGSRGIGAEVSWLAPLPWYVELVGDMTDAAGDCCARSFLGGDDLAIRGVRDFLYTVAVKQFFPFGPAWSLSWGLSGQFGPNATGPGNRTEIYGTDLYLRYKPVGSPEQASLSLQTEGLLRVRQVPGDSLRDWGVYTQAVWHFLKRWETGARFDVVSGLAGDPLDPDWTGDRRRYAVQATFHPSHFTRLRLQGSLDDSAWRGLVRGAFLGLEVAVGAHGAHAF